MSIQIQHVDTSYVQQVWPLVEGHLHAALDKGNAPADYNIHHVQMFLTTGQWMLLVAVDEDKTVVGAATVSFVNYPLNRVAFITTIGGKLLIDENTVEQLKALLKHRGATKIQGLVRPAMERFLEKFDFTAGNKLVEVML